MVLRVLPSQPGLRPGFLVKCLMNQAVSARSPKAHIVITLADQALAAGGGPVIYHKIPMMTLR